MQNDHNMKNLKIISFLALIALSVMICGCGENKNNKITQSTESIIINQNAGEYEDAIALLTDTINSKYTFGVINRFDDFTVSKSIISSSALQYLEEYIIANCNEKYPIEKDLEEAFHFYYVKIVRDTGVYNCYYYTKDINVVQNYFVGMQSWIDKSEYGHQLKQLSNYLNRHIQSLEKEKVSRGSSR
ncbi:MAG: hypothetical protein BGO31_05280 [Bacteroidetes bacterium 43-16]|nr:MAG: hypothetical protein BGO31_05280 [Bacteroidetes bacterium 43-16]